MKTKILFSSLFVIAITAGLFPGCIKDAVNNQKVSYADRNSIFAQQTFDQEEGQIDFTLLTPGTTKSTKDGSASVSGCLTVTLDWLETPTTMTLDFGATNCHCADGNYRRGKMLVTFNGPLTDSLTIVSLTFENYFVNENQVIGTRTITNKGHNAAGHINYDITTNGSIVLADNGGTITYHSNHNREWTEGENNLMMGDDVYSFTGSSSGTTIEGQTFAIAITTPLVWKMSCNHFVSGVIELKPDGEAKRVIDYGTGECDNIATVTVLGYSFQITLG